MTLRSSIGIVVMVQVHGFLSFSLAKEELELVIFLIQEIQGHSVCDGFGPELEVYGQIVGDRDCDVDVSFGVDAERAVVVVIFEEAEEEVVGSV